VDGVDIVVDNDDSIQDLRMKINTATNSKGEKLGVSASVVKISDTNFRLVLGAKNTGSAGVSYSDVTGSTLQNLGIITNAEGDKGNIKQSISSSANIDTAFSDLAVGESIQYAGTDSNGNAISNIFIKGSTSTINDFLKQVENTYNGTVNATIDSTTGKLIVEDKSSGTSKLSMGTFTTGATSQTVTITTVGKEGAGVLSTGKDSYLSVENIYMSNSSNSVTGTFTGVTFELHNTTVGNPTKVTLTRDSDAVQKKFQDLIDSYNALAKYAKSATAHKDPNNKDSTDGELAGDSTLMSIVSQVRAQLKQEFGLFGTAGKYTNLTMFGMKTDVTTGELSLDGSMFKKGFDTHFNDMLNIFTTIGVSENTSLALGRSTTDTSSGKYQLEEVDSEHVRIKLDGATDWFTSDARVGDIVSFSDGPAKGLTLTAPTGSIAAAGNTFTFSKGLSAFLDEAVSKFNDAHDGLISLRQESWRKSMSTKDAQITKLKDQNERYRLRLTSQYSAMEQAMSTLQSQTAGIINNLSK
jgi:flagellar capping protein FliD